MKPAGAIFNSLLFSAVAAAQQYVISTYAGGAPPPTPALAVGVPFGPGFGVAADAAGNVYFRSLYCAFKLDQNGVLTRVAGNSRAGYSGDGGPATSAQLGAQWGVAVDGAGDLFLAEDIRVRKVSPEGIITTVAGNGTPGFSGDGGPATGAQLNGAIAVAVDKEGTLFIADYRNNRIRKVAKTGIITTVAGNGISLGDPNDGGPATSAALNQVTGVAVDGTGNLFIADVNVVRQVSPDGIISTVDTSAQIQPWDVAVDSAGNLFIAEYLNNRIRKVSPNGTVTTIAGGGTAGLGDNGPATSAELNAPAGLAVDGAGNLFIATDYTGGLRKVSPYGIITTVVGNGNPCCFSGDGGPATGAQLRSPSSVAVDGARNLFIAGDNRIRKVTPAGIITTVAGNGTLGFSGDGGPATAAQLNGPRSLAVDAAGNLFLADGNGRIRKVSPSGIITTVAGNGVGGYFGDGGLAINAQVVAGGIAIDSAGNLFIAAGNVRKVSPAGIITTVAGSGIACREESCPPLGDGGPATSAGLDTNSVAVDRAGDLLIADFGNDRIRKVTPDGIITTLAENVAPCNITADGADNVFIAECFPGGISRVSASGLMTRLATPGGGYSGDGGPAIGAGLSNANGVAVDDAGNVYVADSLSNAVRILRPTNRTVLIGAVLDAASQRADPISPGKIVVIYGGGLGPAQLSQNQAVEGRFGTQLGGTIVSFNGIAAPILYASATQVAAVVPYAVSRTTVQVTVAYQGQISDPFVAAVAPSTPSFFTANQSGAGQVAAINASNGKPNTATNPVRVGDYITLYATGEGQTIPAGVDGKLVDSTSIHPVLTAAVTVGGIKAFVQYAGGAPGQVAGLLQINAQIPPGVQPGGYVPVVLQIGNSSTTPDAVWIAVSAN